MDVPKLVDRYAARDPSFTDLTLAWLREIERILERNRLAVAADVASMRAAIISARNSGHPIGPSVSLRRMTRRKIAEIAAEQMMRAAVDVVSKRVHQDVLLINKAEESAYELVIVGRQLKIIPLAPMATMNPTALRALWDQLTESEVTRKYTTYIRSLIGQGDALILLDRVLGK